MNMTVAHKAQHYFHHSDLQRIMATRALKHIEIKPSSHILDYGCGDGKISVIMALQSQSVVGADIDTQMIDFASLKYPNLVYDNLNFVLAPKGDGSDLPATAFDIITLFNVLHLVYEPQKLLEQLNLRLRKGGAILATLPLMGKTAYQEAVALLMNKYQITWPSKHVEYVPIHESLAQMCDDLEMSVELYRDEHRYAFIDANEFAQWSLGVQALPSHLDEQSQHNFYLDLVDAYKQIDPESEGARGTFLPETKHLIFKIQKK